MKRFIFASHYHLAYGLKDTIDYLTNHSKQIYDINAYVNDDVLLEKQVKEVFDGFCDDDEVIILADLLGGSVYQAFFPYLNDRVHLICGMNLPLALSFVLISENTPFTTEKIVSLIEESKNQIVYINDLRINLKNDVDDE